MPFGEAGSIMVLSLIAIQIAIILYVVAKNQSVKFEKEYDLTRELRLLDRFEEFIRKYDKVYDSNEEFAERFRIYVNNMLEAQKLNQRNRDYGTIYGENEFADWNVNEFREILLPKDFFKNLRKKSTFIDSFIDPPETVLARREEIPDHFDWRPYNVVTPVKSQFKCGSCWAFATVGTVESAYALGTGELRSLSEQQLLDCNLENNACDGGDVDKALRYVYDEGLMREYDYPYVAHRQDTCQLRGETTRIKAAVFLHQDEASIIDWLLHYGPVNVGINVTADMKAYKGGVYTPDKWECENKIIGTHSINIVGYGTWNATNQKYWIVKNSWGQSYGIEDGYVYFARGINSCGIEDEPVGVLA
uniref:Cathepsin L-like cysteine proteinase n=1 Tax=Toxocara canis TaxID=6265 RepID=Q26888_TOXCA|nr:cathepsin L-like cysteine proteinase [Toxocara canis]